MTLSLFTDDASVSKWSGYLTALDLFAFTFRMCTNGYYNSSLVKLSKMSLEVDARFNRANLYPAFSNQLLVTRQFLDANFDDTCNWEEVIPVGNNYSVSYTFENCVLWFLCITT